MFRDTVIDDRSISVFQGTPQDTVEWLETYVGEGTFTVHSGELGHTMSVREYLAREKYSEVYNLVRLAMMTQDSATHRGEPLSAIPFAETITKKIIALG